MITHPPIDSRIKEIRNWIDSDDYAGDPGCGDCHDARDWLEKAMAIIADLRGNPSPDSLCDDIQKNAENYVKYGLGQQAMITETTGKTRDGDPSGRRPNAVSGAKAGAAAIALLEPIANFDWTGKWRIQKALEKLRQHYAGDASTRKDEGCIGTTAPEPHPASAVTTPLPRQASEISVVDDTMLLTLLDDKAHNIEPECDDGYSTGYRAVTCKVALDVLRPYLRTTEPVFVSLGECVAILKLNSKEYETNEEMAKAVLDAAGVAYD